MKPGIDRSRSNWWWIFAFLIAAPAVALAALGLRTVRLDRVEWAQQINERQVQAARLADVAVGNLLAELETALRQPTSDAARREAFSFDNDGTITFTRERVYFLGPDHRRPASIEPAAASARLIAETQAAEAQQRYDEALRLLQRIPASMPALADWAQWTATHIERARRNGAASAGLVSPHWSRSDGLSPSGLPIALVASTYAGRLPRSEQASFLPLLHGTLGSLRAGRWLLSFDERSFYDAELLRLIASAGGAGASTLVPDPQLSSLAGLERLVRRAAPSRRGISARTAELIDGRTTLLLWSPQGAADANQWVGMALSEDEIRTVIDTAVRQLLTTDSFNVALRDHSGRAIWQQAPGEFETANIHALRAIPGWDLAFSKPRDPAGLSQRRALWFGLILMLVSLLGTGLWMTARARQEEIALGRRQADFVAAVSHEFKSPLTSIRLYMERLSRGRSAVAESTEYYLAVEQETARLERLVNRLLESQQLQEGRKVYVLEAASLTAAARTAIARLRPQAEAKRVHLELRAHEDSAEAVIDSAAVADAIENLIENAIKYSPEESTVAVAIDAANDAVRVQVEDRGIGIDAQDVPRIFDKFFRGRRGDAADVRGTGLGLSLVKAIVDGHGGSIAVSSVPGSGSCFSLTFPRQPRTGSQAVQ